MVAQRGSAQATPNGGQTNAWVTAALVKIQMGTSPTAPEGPTGTALVRSVRAGAVERLEFNQNPNAGQWDSGPMMPPGLVVLTTSSDTGVSIIVLDSMQKTFTTANIHEPPSFPPGMRMAGIPIPQAHVSDIVVTVDSIGPGPVVLGHPTVRYHQTRRVTLQTDMTKMMTMIMRSESSADIDIATDIPNAPRITGWGIERLVEMIDGLAISNDLAPAMRAAVAKYPRNGVVLHVEGYQNGPQGYRVVKLDVTKAEAAHVDAALLAPPAGFTKGYGMGGMGFGMGMGIP
jgi:hypothetical protein